MRIHPPESIDLPTLAGNMRTHLFRPLNQGRFPGIVLFSEIYQMTGPIARTAAFIAGHGYVVAVPEVYHEFAHPGEVFAYDPAGTERGNQLKITKELAHYDDDAKVALAFLQSHPHCNGKLGTVGICLGGHLAFRAAMNSNVSAGVCFYATDIHKRSLGKGLNDDTLDRMGEIQGEMMMVWGRQDPHIPIEGRRIIYDAMTHAHLNFTWHEFNGEHAFLRDEGHRYDPALAQLIFPMVFDLFGRKLNA
jgi:carboxymethylenebutenolidase